MREGVLADELCARAFAAKAQVLELHQRDHRVIVVGLNAINRCRLHARLRIEIIRIERPAGAVLHRVIRKRVVALNRALDARERNTESHGIVLTHHHEGFGAGAGHDAIEQTERFGNRARIEIVIERQRLLEQRMFEVQGVVTLRDAQLAKVLARDALGAHGVLREEGEAGVRPAGAVRIDRVARELAEVGQRQTKRVSVIGVARDAGDIARIARLHGARGAAQRHHAGCAAEWNVIEPARRDAELLGQADGAVGGEREA